jgi:hypothetical protein
MRTAAVTNSAAPHSDENIQKRSQPGEWIHPATGRWLLDSRALAADTMRRVYGTARSRGTECEGALLGVAPSG